MAWYTVSMTLILETSVEADNEEDAMHKGRNEAPSSSIILSTSAELEE